jgi:hypothetical protein
MRSILPAIAICALVSLPSREAIAQAMPAPDWQPRCPPAGTEVVGSDGVRVRYEGPAPDAPLSCLVEGLGPRVFGLPPAAGDVSRIQGPWIAHQLRAGTIDRLAGSRPRASPCPHTSQFLPDAFYVTPSLERVQIPAASIDVIVLRYDHAAYECGIRAEFAFRQVWIDVQTGVPLRVSIHQTSGPPDQPGGRRPEERIEWRAVSISLP